MAEEAQETSAQVDQLVVFSCSNRLGETNVQDFSLWHHLSFCEELQNDYYKDVVCWLCNEPVLGCPVYKCLQCNFHQHKLCIARPHGVDTEIEHKYWWKRHHLTFIQKPDNGGEWEVVCSRCKKATIGPAYKCSIPECAFLLHKSCGEVSNVIDHPIHPEHTSFSKSHQRVTIVLVAIKMATDPSFTVATPVLLTSTLNSLPIGELMTTIATNTHFIPHGSRCSSLANLVVRKPGIPPTYVANVES